MRPYHRHCAFLGVLLFIFTLAVAPALAATSVDLETAGGKITYAGTPVNLTATVTVDGTPVTDPEIQWSLGDPSLGTLVAVYGEAVYTPAIPVTALKWDSVATVIYGVYGEITGELPLTVYPAEAQNDALARAKAYLRAQQAADGSLTDDWAAIALATAGENLTADYWLKNGKGHLDTIATAVYGWDVGSTPTTTIARTLLAVALAEDADANVDPRDCGGRDLVALLEGRQDAETGHFGNAKYLSYGYPCDEATYVNAHVWSILALDAAEVQIPNVGLAEERLRDYQNSNGSWGYDTAWPSSDPDMTAMALRALAALGADETDSDAIEGLDFLEDFQKPSGGFAALAYDEYYSPIGPAEKACADTTAEVVMALNTLALNPWEQTKDGNNPVDYLYGLQLADGSFASQENSQTTNDKSTSASLMALAYTNTLFPGGGGNNPGNPGGGDNAPETITVTAEVRGLDGTTMYPSQTVTLESGEQTPLGVLEALGADVETGFGGGYVVSIDGLAEKQHGATSGWCYLVNDCSPDTAANAYVLDDGDDVLWRYVRSLSETGNLSTDIPYIAPSLAPTLEAGVDAVDEALTDITTGAHPRTAVLNSTPLDDAAAVKLGNSLEANRVTLEQEVDPENQTLVADALLEAGLSIPPGALNRNVVIRIQEQNTPEDSPAPLGQSLASGIYEYGPDGQSFNEAVTVYIRCLPDEDRAPGDLVLAWFDSAAGQWRPLTAVYDPATGLLAARVTHFTRFAALSPSGPRPVFTDLPAGDEAPWYAETVEQLAARGVIGADEGPAFRGEAPVTRAAFTGWLARGLGLLPGTRPTFADLEGEHAYYEEIGAAAAADLMRGCPGNSFAPEAHLTRQELAAILVRAAADQKTPPDGSPDQAETLLAGYSDGAAVAAWARSAVAEAVRAGLMVGVSGNCLNPCGTVTRGEAAVFVQRLVN